MATTDDRFRYDPATFAALEAAISRTRCTTYRKAAGTDERALQLYVWNTAVSAAFYGPLQAFEVALRNAIHEALSATSGVRWFEHSAVLRRLELGIAAAAVQRLHDMGKPPTPGRVVAELPLGFWVGLFANVYDESLWRTTLHGLFTPRTKNRHGLHDELNRLRTLRNRIAHHEPIFQRRLEEDYAWLLRIVHALDRATERWIEHHSRVRGLLATRPDRVESF